MRRACRRARLPVPDVPEELRRERPPQAARDLRARARPSLHPALDAHVRRRHRLLSARLVHDEAQPAGQRAGRELPRLPRSAPAPGGGRRAGRARAHVAPPGDPRRGRRAARGLAPARGRLPGRADRTDAHARVLRRARRVRHAAQDRHPRHRPRNEPGERDDGGLRGDAGPDRPAREHRRRRPPRPRSTSTPPG